jgi:hypothetical protein
MNRIRRAITLLKTSWGVLRIERHLALLPVLSAITSLLVFGILAVAAWATLGQETGVDGTTNPTANLATIIIGIVGYLALSFVTVYFTAALVSGADTRLRGGDSDLGSCLATANARLVRILEWSAVVATVSLIINATEERFGFVGDLVAGLVSAAWNVVTFLAIPIIVLEDLAPLAALKRSGTLLKATWGENIAGNAGFGLLGFFAVFLPAGLLVGLGIAANNPYVGVPLFTIAGIYAVIGATVLSALSGIFRTALYRYAVDGQVPEAFAGAGVEDAFIPKRAGKR